MGRRAYLVIAVAVATFVAGTVDLNACGDKFLRIGRSPRYRAYAAVYPTAILIYVPASSTAAAVKAYEEMLARAGHRPQAVWTLQAFTEALGTEKYGIVIAGLSDASRLRDHVSTRPVKPAVLPIVHRPSKSQRALIERDFQHVLEAEWTKYETLAELDHVIEIRQGSASATNAMTR